MANTFHVHKKCKHCVNHTTHAKCNHHIACPDRILHCFYDEVGLSITKRKQQLPIIQWNQDCHTVTDGQNRKPYVIYTLYINIFQRQEMVCSLFG